MIHAHGYFGIKAIPPVAAVGGDSRLLPAAPRSASSEPAARPASASLARSRRSSARKSACARLT